MCALAVPALALAGLTSAAAAPGPTANAVSSAPIADPSADAVVIFTVRAADGDLVGLATRLDAAGYQVAGRTADALWVQGTAATARDLAARPGLVVVSSQLLPELDEHAPSAGQDPILPRRLDGRTYETFYGGYRTVDGFHAFEDDLADAYPHLVQVVDYGTSWTGDIALRAV